MLVSSQRGEWRPHLTGMPRRAIPTAGRFVSAPPHAKRRKSRPALGKNARKHDMTCHFLPLRSKSSGNQPNTWHGAQERASKTPPAPPRTREIFFWCCKVFHLVPADVKNFAIARGAAGAGCETKYSIRIYMYKRSEKSFPAGAKRGGVRDSIPFHQVFSHYLRAVCPRAVS